MANLERPNDVTHSSGFLRELMRRQLRLSISCALAFSLFLLALPLLNYFWPEQMALSLFGFTLSWFFLGILFFPLVWVISYVFIKRSLELERQEVEIARSSQRL